MIFTNREKETKSRIIFLIQLFMQLALHHKKWMLRDFVAGNKTTNRQTLAEQRALSLLFDYVVNNDSY